MKVLHEYCRTNIDTVGPLLTQLDVRVRHSILSASPEQRLDIVVRTATEPWLYMFVPPAASAASAGPWIERLPMWIQFSL